MPLATPLKLDNGITVITEAAEPGVMALGGTHHGIFWFHTLAEIITNIKTGKYNYINITDAQVVTEKVGIDDWGVNFSRRIRMDSGRNAVAPLRWEILCE